MKLDLSIAVNDQATPVLKDVKKRLHSRVDLNQRIAENVEVFTRDYLRILQGLRHRTADALGAQRTGFFERAAESPEGRGTSDAAILTLSPGAAFARAFGEVTIQPGPGREYLTIPVNAASYGRRAGEFEDLQFIMTGKGVPVLAKPQDRTRILVVFYLLVKEVTQKQERDLLPSDEDWLAMAEEAARDFVLANTTAQPGESAAP